MSYINIWAGGFKNYDHRGFRGRYPEHTLVGYRAAIHAGADVVDADIQWTIDDEPLCYHDTTISRDITMDSSGNYISFAYGAFFLKKLTYAQVKTLYIGNARATSAYSRLFLQQKKVEKQQLIGLRELLSFLAEYPKIGLQIELKKGYNAKKIAGRLVEVLEQGVDLSRVEVQSFDWEYLKEIRELRPQMKLAYLTRRFADNKQVIEEIKSMHGDIWGPDASSLTREDIEGAHQLGLKVVPWFNAKNIGGDFDEPLARRLMKDGVDGLITDRPDLVEDIRGDLWQ